MGHLEGPILVLAGAGSGKTRVLTARVAALIDEHGVTPDRVLAVTFTNKAAGEMRQRITGLLGREPTGAWIGTFHAVGARLLRRHSERLGWDPAFTIFDAEESLREIKRVTEAQGLDPKRWKPKAVRAALSDAKNQLISPARFQEEHGESLDFFARTVARIYPAYQKSLKDQNAFDFDDLLVKPVELFEAIPDLLARYQERFGFILVDEYQDTNHAQFRFLEALASRHRNLMVVGDDDQSIYGWRGADIRNILDFERTFPGAKVVRLEQNYRSTGVILQAANEVIRQNRQRKEKSLRTDREKGGRIELVETSDERDEANWLVRELEQRVADGDLPGYRSAAILYRTNAQSRALEDAFRRKGIPYQIVGGVRFYERREIQDVLAYLRLISNPLDQAAFDRVVNVPRRGVGKATRERLQKWADETGSTLLEGAERAEEVPGLPAGGVKGLRRFAALIREFSARAAHLAVGPLVEELVDRLDLLQHLRDEGPDGDDRAENVKELVAGAMDFELRLQEEWEGEAPEHFTELDLFLQQAALVTDLDRHDPDSDAVTFMTLHNAKGLEYPWVFIAGLEDGLFPLGRAYDEPAQLEEERRLFYVGITRAQDRLFMSWARERRRAGDVMPGRLSSFVEAIPDEILLRRRSPGVERASRESRRWEGRAEDPFGSAARRARRSLQGSEAESREEAAFESDLNQDRAYLTRGERVRHGTFGSGTVLEISGSGSDVRVTVRFDSIGTKKLLARYAGLERDF